MLGFELAHVGVNVENEKEAVKAAERFAFLFGMPVKAGGIGKTDALRIIEKDKRGENQSMSICSLLSAASIRIL